MARKLRMAAVRMLGKSAPVGERLQRADALVAQAAKEGAQLVVLPELFNIGYEYHENNYTLPEPIDGQTVTWMKDTAKRYNVHLSGSLLLVDGKDVYNSQILISPDGRRWRYDKNYPFAFERAYFRDGSETMIAHTDIGSFGMMICWDYSHPELWQRYAGQVDAMIITSSPPKMLRFELTMPNGQHIDSRALGPLLNRGYHGNDEPFGKDLDAQAAWLGVPLVNTTHSGEFHTFLPRARAMAMLYLMFRPDLWGQVGKGEEMEMRTTYYNQTKIVSGTGEVLARVTSDEGVSVVEVELADTAPAAPTEPQPEIPFSTAAYFFADVLAPALMEQAYRDGIRRHWGQKMAPFQRSIRWSIVLGLGLLGIVAALLRGVGQLTSGGKKR